MRHLYAGTDNQIPIALAKGYERRRCNHHTLEKPLSTLECLSSVVDSKGNNTNKHRYVVASQDPEVRAHMRSIPGVPLIYISRSVLIMEPMAGASDEVRLKEERSKFRQGLKMRTGSNSVLGKRGREEREEREEGEDDEVTKEEGTQGKAKARKRTQKEPNPLSMKKPKKRVADGMARPEQDGTGNGVLSTERSGEEGDASQKRKRKRKSSKRDEEGGTAAES
jgi:U3 small nucleolar RNA-associated protein 23